MRKPFSSTLYEHRGSIVCRSISSYNISKKAAYRLLELAWWQCLFVALFHRGASLVTLTIHTGGLFGYDKVVVVVQEPCHPHRSHALMYNATDEISYHTYRRWELSLSRAFSILYKLIPLLWAEVLLVAHFGCTRCWYALVSPRQRRSINVVIRSNFSIRKRCAVLARVD
jgi:hypothetical protein